MHRYFLAVLGSCACILSTNAQDPAATTSPGSYVVQLPSTASGVKIPPYSHGISLEMSHWNTVFGPSGNKQSISFLQLLRNIQDRRGQLMLRLGGNSQDAASADEMVNGPMAKTGEQAARANSGATTFNIKVSHRLFDAMDWLSQHLGVLWTFGLNFENATEMTSAMELGRQAVEMLGDRLHALQIGNEPDLYAKHGLRPAGWGVPEYTAEWLAWASALSEQFGNPERKDLFTGGVVCCTWELQQLLDSGYFDRSKALIKSMTVQRYSSNACFGVYKGRASDYLSHSWITTMPRQSYEQPVQRIVSQGKEVIMGETNTAACGGIPGVSDTYVSSLWWVDWQMFLYSLGFASIELQLGGQSSHYNPMSKVGGSWIANPVYYGSLVTAEALGPADSQPQVVHVAAPDDQRVVYAVFHKGALKYAVLLNMNPDNDAPITLQHPWNTDRLKAKRLLAPSIHEKHNIQWAGRTLRNATDGILQGNLQIDTLTCDQPGACTVLVPKASVAIVGPEFDIIRESPVLDEPYDVTGLLNSTSSSANTGFHYGLQQNSAQANARGNTILLWMMMMLVTMGYYH